jgi:hypothetical protein
MNYQYCNAKTEKSNEGMLKTNGPPFQDGTGKAAFSPFCRAHVLEVRSARQHKGVPLRDKLSNFALRDAASNTAALLDNFFDHSRRTPDSEFFWGIYGLFARNIQQAQ